MWIFYVFLYVVLAVIFTQNFKIVTKTSKCDGNLTVLLQLLAGIIVLLLCPLFKMNFPADYKVYIFLFIACIFYAISDRLNTSVRSGVEASTFSILKQISTVFMIFAGLLFFKEPFVLKKIIGAVLIIFCNILIFYKKSNTKFNKYIIFGILSNLSYSIALFIDVNLSEKFNLPFYVSMTLVIPAIFIFIFEKLKVSDIKKEFVNGNKKAILITGLCWGTTIVTLLKAYQLGNVTSVAPLSSLTVILNVIVSYLFLNEKNNLPRKLIAAILIIISVILIKT